MAQQQRIGRRTAVRTAGSALAVGAALATGMVARTARAGDGAGSLVGTWVVSSTRAGTIPNAILVTVLADGGFLRTGNAHPTESPAMGRWQQVDDGVYDVTYRALQFDNAGTFIGHRKTWIRITLDPAGDSFSGLARVVTIDVSGVEAAPTAAEIVGIRMVVEPFA